MWSPAPESLPCITLASLHGPHNLTRGPTLPPSYQPAKGSGDRTELQAPSGAQTQVSGSSPLPVAEGLLSTAACLHFFESSYFAIKEFLHKLSGANASKRKTLPWYKLTLNIQT